MLDCELLKEVYINLLGQKEPKLKLENSEFIDIKFKEKNINSSKVERKVISPSKEELELHKKYLKESLSKNYF